MHREPAQCSLTQADAVTIHPIEVLTGRSEPAPASLCAFFENPVRKRVDLRHVPVRQASGDSWTIPNLEHGAKFRGSFDGIEGIATASCYGDRDVLAA
jgi:hypothetical protein